MIKLQNRLKLLP